MSASSKYIAWQNQGQGHPYQLYYNRIGDTAQTLANKYSPILIMHHDEVFSPKPVEFALNMPLTTICRWDPVSNSIDPDFFINANSLSLQANSSSNMFINFPGNAEDTATYFGYDQFKFLNRYVAPYLNNAGNYPDAVYSHIVTSEDGSQTAIEYWFFYYVNNYFDFHEGDWENVNVILEPGADKNLVPTKCANLVHDSGIWREWNQVEGSGSHPLIYVANGSHESYFDAPPGLPLTGTWTGLHLVNWKGFSLPIADYTDPNGRMVPLHDVRVLPDAPLSDSDDSFGWLAFAGNWGEINKSDWAGNNSMIRTGEDRSGPPGPPFQGTWRDPFTWQQNLPCDGCQDDSGTQTGLEVTKHSPVDIRVYDSQGRVMAKRVIVKSCV